MPLIDVNFDNVPDSIPLIPIGLYTWIIKEAPTVEENKDKNGFNMVAECFIIGSNNPDAEGRQQTYYGAIKTKNNSANDAVGAKRLFLACGIRPTGNNVQTEVLVGKTFQAPITHGTYMRDGVARPVSRMGDLIIPPEMGVK